MITFACLMVEVSFFRKSLVSQAQLVTFSFFFLKLYHDTDTLGYDFFTGWLLPPLRSVRVFEGSYFASFLLYLPCHILY